MTKNQVFTILQRAGGIRAARIITEHEKNLPWIKVLFIAHKLRRGIPVAKIIHKKWFFGLPFYTNKHTLDPRPDTETLVSAVISDCQSDTQPRILDLGTGTGCIICALITNIYGSSGIALDKSRGALRVAKKNIKRFNLTDKIKTIRASFYTPIKFNEKFDIIVSNPPYIAKNDLRVDSGALHDPKMALYAPDNGLLAYKKISKHAHNWVTDDGRIYLEIGINQGNDIKQIFIQNGWNLERCENDLAGIERVLVFSKARQ